MKIIKKILLFFDRLEDKVRASLSRRPLVYAFVGGIGVVLFWRGVWMTADQFVFMTGPVSMAIGTIILLLVGLWVSVFVGDEIIISGLKKEYKKFEKVSLEIENEGKEIDRIEDELEDIEKVIIKRKNRKIKKVVKK